MTQHLSAFHKVKEWIAGSLSRPKLANLLAQLGIFFASTQLGLHFWPSSSLVYGIRIDYLAPTFYFLDLLIILYLVAKGSDLKGSAQPGGKVRPYWYFIPIVLVNLLFSQNPLATLSWSLHVLLYLSFICTLDLKVIPLPLTLSVFFQVLLGFLQVSLGHTLQGPLYYLGERSLAVGQPGIATAQLFGSTMLRAYGTFSHPNVLAGWLVVSLLMLWWLTKNQSRKVGILSLVIVGVLLTESRAAALALFGIVIPLFLVPTKIRLPYYVGLLVFCFFFYTSLLSPSRADFSLKQRLDLQLISLKVTQAFPLFGAGTAGSIQLYPVVAPNYRLLQPDHDSLTLLLSWFGVFGVLAMLFSLRPCNIRPSLFYVLPLVPLLLFDHYLLTSPQGLFILLLYVKLVVALH